MRARARVRVSVCLYMSAVQFTAMQGHVADLPTSYNFPKFSSESCWFRSKDEVPDECPPDPSIALGTPWNMSPLGFIYDF